MSPKRTKQSSITSMGFPLLQNPERCVWAQMCVVQRRRKKDYLRRSSNRICLSARSISRRWRNNSKANHVLGYSWTCGPTLILLRGNRTVCLCHHDYRCGAYGYDSTGSTVPCVTTLWTSMCFRTLRRRSRCHGIDNHQQARVKTLRTRYHGQVL